MIDENRSIGVSVGGNGGMNTEYKGGSARFFVPAAFGGPNDFVTFPGTFGDGTAGVDLAPASLWQAELDAAEVRLHELAVALARQHRVAVGAVVDRLVVLRGDRPDGLTASGPFQYANELVAFIRREFGVRWVRLSLNKQGAVRGASDVGVIIERGERF